MSYQDCPLAQNLKHFAMTCIWCHNNRGFSKSNPIPILLTAKPLKPASHFHLKMFLKKSTQCDELDFKLKNQIYLNVFHVLGVFPVLQNAIYCVTRMCSCSNLTQSVQLIN